MEDKTKTEDDSLVPVLSYLEDNIVVLHKSLLELNFVRVLQMFWNVTCQEMLHALRVFSKSKDVRQEGQFFERVNIIVPYLVTYFEGSGGGLNEEEIDTKNYRALLLFLKCLSLPTDKLIAAYYREAAEQQMVSARAQCFNFNKTAMRWLIVCKFMYRKSKFLPNLVV